ncbi:MAG: hypothetical protein AB7O24_16280 [Kofleriaceae bacterium]
MPDGECGPITSTVSQSGFDGTCGPVSIDLTVPEGKPSAVLVSACIRYRYGQSLPRPTVSYREVPLDELGFADSHYITEDVGGESIAFHYRSALYWAAGIPGGVGQVVSTSGTTNGNGECWFTASAYSGAATDRPVFAGAITELTTARLEIDSASEQLAVAQLCVKSFDTTMDSLDDGLGQTRRSFDQSGTNSAISATADKPGSSPVVTMEWTDQSGVSQTARRAAIGGVSLQPDCPTCIRIADPPMRRTTIASDDFNRPDGPLGDSWHDGYADESPLAIVSGRLRVGGAMTHDSIESWHTGTSAPDDQWASVTLAAHAGSGLVASGVLVRWADPPEVKGYACRAERQGTKAFSTIQRFGDGQFRVLASTDIVEWAPGDTIRCEVEQHLLRMFHIRDGIETLVLLASDSQHDGGRPGIIINSDTPSEGELDDFATGGFTPP